MTMICPFCNDYIPDSAVACPGCDAVISGLAFPFKASPDLIALCGHWHSGQTSAMYSVLSTGNIHSPEILSRLESELCHTVKYVSTSPLDADLDALEQWHHWADDMSSKNPVPESD